VGQYVEGLAFSDDGNYLAVIPQNGSNLAPSHPFYNDHGLLVVFSVDGTKLTKLGEVKIGQMAARRRVGPRRQDLAGAEHGGQRARHRQLRRQEPERHRPSQSHRGPRRHPHGWALSLYVERLAMYCFRSVIVSRNCAHGQHYRAHVNARKCQLL
jgi:hypothetical protein